MRVEAASLNARTVAVLAHCYFILPESAMSKIVIVYHSGYGHTKKVAEAVLAGATEAGAQARLLPVGDIDDAGWAELAAADAIIFGAPTYMGGPSADFKKFADANRDNIAEDHSGATVFLARNDWQLGRAKQDFPALRFLQTREQAPLTQASA